MFLVIKKKISGDLGDLGGRLINYADQLIRSHNYNYQILLCWLLNNIKIKSLMQYFLK